MPRKKVAKKKVAKKRAVRQSPEDRPLNAQEESFCHLYRSGPDGIRGNAGMCYNQVYSTGPKLKVGQKIKKGDTQNAYVLLQRPAVRKYLRERFREVEKEADLKQVEIIQEWKRIGFLDPRRAFNPDGSPLKINEMPDDVAASIAAIEVDELTVPDTDGGQESRSITRTRIKFHDKMRALDSMAKHKGMFVDQVNHLHLHSLVTMTPEQFAEQRRNVEERRRLIDRALDVLEPEPV